MTAHSFFVKTAEPSVQATLARLTHLADLAADEWAETGSDAACETLAKCEELIHRVLEMA